MPPARRRLGGLLAMALGLAWIALAGCGGGGGTGSFTSAGVGNGTIAGSVFGIVGGTPGLVPLSGVRVVATRVGGGFALTRTAFSDASGTYTFFDVPLGTWDLSYQLVGFTGATGGATPLRTFVESGGLAVVPDVTMTQTTGPGSGGVTIFVVDGATGAPVTGATVTVGGFPASFVGLDGSYVFDVPVTGGGVPLPIQVFHPGFSGSVPFPATVTPVPGFPVSLTVSLEPSQGFVTGSLRASSFQTLYAGAGALGSISITSPQIASSFLAPLVNPSTGFFEVQVPPSTLGGSQFFDLVFTSPFFQQTTVANIQAPGPGGTASLSSAVTLQPLQSTVTGTLISGSGVVPSGFPNQVVVVETGQATTPVNGTYTLVGLPAGLPVTLQASVQGAFGAELGSVGITPLPGTFSAPPILTN